MRWIGDRESENVEDRRGGAGGLPVGIGGVGAIVVVLVGLFLGVDPSTLLALLSGDETQQQIETRQADDGYGSSRMPEAGRARSEERRVGEGGRVWGCGEQGREK